MRASPIGRLAGRPATSFGMRETLWGYLLISPWLIGFLVFKLVPIGASFWLSLHSYEVLTPPRWVGPRNYTTFVFQDELFGKSLYNTAYYVVFSVPLGVAVALLLALLLNLKLPGVRVFRTVFYVPVVTPVVAVSVLWLFIFSKEYGLLNLILGLAGVGRIGWLSDPAWAKPSLVLMSLWGVGGTMVIFLAGLQSVPVQIYDAAAIDGANGLARFRHITLPMLSPVTFFTLVLGMIGSFQTFTQAYVMTNGGPADATLFYALYLYQQAFPFLQMGYASAMAWILLAIVLVLTLVQFGLGRRWVYYEGETPR